MSNSANKLKYENKSYVKLKTIKSLVVENHDFLFDVVKVIYKL